MSCFISKLTPHTNISYNFKYFKNEIPDILFKEISFTLPITYPSNYSAIPFSEELVKPENHNYVKSNSNEWFDVSRSRKHAKFLEKVLSDKVKVLLRYANRFPGAPRNIIINFILIEMEVLESEDYTNSFKKLCRSILNKTIEICKSEGIEDNEFALRCVGDVSDVLQCKRFTENDKNHFLFYNIEEIINETNVSLDLYNKESS